MADPAFLVENFYSLTQFIAHVVDAEEEASGRQAFRVANGRRSGSDFWTPTTGNSDTWLRVDNVVSRQAATIALDRGHNLPGKTVLLQRSTDNFAADTTTVFTATIPSATSPDDTALSDANGVLTPEGAWVKSFTAVSSRYWRLLINAMGAGLKPIVVGLWLGDSWLPGKLTLPMTDEDDVLVLQETVLGSTGWVGGTLPVRRRQGELVFKLSSIAAYANAAKHIRDNFGLRRPMWIVHDTSRGERAVLAVRPTEALMFKMLF